MRNLNALIKDMSPAPSSIPAGEEQEQEPAGEEQEQEKVVYWKVKIQFSSDNTYWTIDYDTEEKARELIAKIKAGGFVEITFSDGDYLGFDARGLSWVAIYRREK